MSIVSEPRQVSRAELGPLADPAAIGSGAAVYRGTLDGLAVAVRQPRITSSAALERFHSQVHLQHYVTVRARQRTCVQRGDEKVSMPVGLLPLLAVCEAPPFYCTVTPWCSGGCVFDVLHKRTTPGTHSILQRLEWALQLAIGLQNLHELGVIHRDVKTANLLLEDDRVLLADFELAIMSNSHSLPNTESIRESSAHAIRQANEGKHRLQSEGTPLPVGPSAGRLAHMVGTTVYMAPELLSAERSGWGSTYASDVYAFGITLNEIVTASVPYVDRQLSEPELHTVLETRFNELQLRTAIVTEHLRPRLDVDALGGREGQRLCELIERCWDADPARRPAMSAVVKELAALVDQLKRYSFKAVRILRSTLAENPEGALAGAAWATHIGDDEVDASQTPRGPAERTRQASAATGADLVSETDPSALAASYFGKDAHEITTIAHELVQSVAHRPFPLSDTGSAAPAGFRQRLDRSSSPASVDRSDRVQAEAYAVSGRRGPDRMEDRHLVASPLQLSIELVQSGPALACWGSSHILGVFDGHGGVEAADFTAALIPDALQRLLGRNPQMRPEQVLRELLCFVDMCWSLWCAQHDASQALGKRGLVGSTALVAMVHSGTLYVANIGDSRAVLFEVQPDTALVPILVTLDQTCTASSQERARLQEQGARVLADSAGTLRVEGLTLVTRAIGDIALKRYLTAEPELYIQHLQPDREYILILATDGLWDVMDVGEVAKIIRGTVQVPGLLARRLVTEALQRETQDNVTVVAALLSTSAAKAPLLPPPGDAAREHA